MKYVLYVETDWDFSLEYKGKVHGDRITLLLNDPKELDDIKISDGKTWEYETAIEEIKKNPNEFFSNIGGNRGVTWSVIEDEKLDTSLTEIARKHLLVDTLETRQSDSLDFHDVHVKGLKEALIAAYELGMQCQNN